MYALVKYRAKRESRTCPVTRHRFVIAETFVCPRRGYFASLRSCSTYFRCETSGETATERRCAGDFVFNARTSNCDYAANVPGCETVSETESETTRRERLYPRTTASRVHVTAPLARRQGAFHHVLSESVDSTSGSRMLYRAKLGRTRESINSKINRCVSWIIWYQMYTGTHAHTHARTHARTHTRTPHQQL